MRVFVIGAGIIGSIYGWALSETGHHVVPLVRPGRAASLPDGIVLDVFDRRKAIPQLLWSLQIENCGSSLSNRVKHHALAQSLREVVPLADTAD